MLTGKQPLDYLIMLHGRDLIALATASGDPAYDPMVECPGFRWARDQVRGAAAVSTNGYGCCMRKSASLPCNHVGVHRRTWNRAPLRRIAWAGLLRDELADLGGQVIRIGFDQD